MGLRAKPRRGSAPDPGGAPTAGSPPAPPPLWLRHWVCVFQAATKKIPWLKMVKSIPLLANMVQTFLANILMTLLSSYLPTYFKDVLLLDIKSVRLFFPSEKLLDI